MKKCNGSIRIAEKANGVRTIAETITAHKKVTDPPNVAMAIDPPNAVMAIDPPNAVKIALRIIGPIPEARTTCETT